MSGRCKQLGDTNPIKVKIIGAVRQISDCPGLSFSIAFYSLKQASEEEIKAVEQGKGNA